MKKIVVVCLLLGLMGCGGGGGGSDSNPVAITGIGFTAADFSGKTIYYVNDEFYQPCTFSPDGTAKTGYKYDLNGWHTLTIESGTWAIRGGVLYLTNAETGEKVYYVLTNDDTVGRYFTTTKNTDDGKIETIGMFYDQVTGLSQAQAFVSGHRIP